MQQQTAVEWLIDQVEDFIGLIPVDIIEKAKQIEKNQHWKTWMDSTHNYSFDEYYNKNYGIQNSI